MNYYKYVSFASFFELVKRMELKLVKPKLWDDKFENILGQIFENESYYSKIYKSINKNYDLLKANEIISRLYNFYETLHASCFTANGDHEGMWKAFSYGGNALQIEVNMDSFSKKIKIDEYHYTFTEINYSIDRNTNYEKFIEENLNGSNQTFGYKNFYSTKRDTFKHENEFRLIAAKGLKINYKTTEDSLDTLQKLKDSTNLNPTKDVEYVDFDNSFIKSVIVNPYAKDEFVWSVERLCEESKIEFKGKSKVYDL